MPPTNPPASPIRLRLLNAQQQPLGGLVDLQITSVATGQALTIKAADASQAIPVPAASALPAGDYQVSVTPADGSPPTSHTVTIPAAGATPVDVVVDRGATTGSTAAPAPSARPASSGSPAYSVRGTLTFDYGLPAAGVSVLVYGIGFGAQEAPLGKAKADAQGGYAVRYAFKGPGAPNIQLRVLDMAGKEVSISATKFGAAQSETLNLVVPAAVSSLAPEYDRLSADLNTYIGGIDKLAQAQEADSRRDLTLLSRSTNWDARLLAFAATAAQQTAMMGLKGDTTMWLYAVYRVGLPTDQQQLATVPSGTVQGALKKAADAGIVSMTDQQITAAMAQFETFATGTRLAMTTPGAVSSFKDLLAAAVPDANQQARFAELYFANPTAGADLWKQAAALNIPAQTLDTLKLQGKLLHLTINNAPLAHKLQQDLGSLDKLAQLADKDYHNAATWKATLTGLAGNGGDAALQQLIPASYTGKTAAERVDAYSADLARKVRLSFPTQVTARMIESKELKVDPASAPSVTAFLRASTALGYELGRTPLNAFLKASGKALPPMDAPATEQLKTVHRMHQLTPSPESMQAVLDIGFTSARQIAKMKKEEFMSRHSKKFPSPGEAHLVYGKAQQVAAVTFNVFTSAKAVEATPPVYVTSPADDSLQSAKDAIVQQFPSMATLFGSTDYCQCDHCRSVLSPAAYFVDLLEFLDGSPTQSAKPITYVDPGATTNPQNVTPLDILIGNAVAKIPGRRPDLAALPLTCENTNTAMPYIDLVNEIFEYYIANNQLDAGAAYDTGAISTEALTAEPQHILPKVYGDGSGNPKNLRAALYPRTLPFDLWIETVRGFLGFCKAPLADVLQALRPVDALELFTDANARPYYRAQILAESLGLSPSDYCVLTATDPATFKPSAKSWYQLYGYADEPTALKELPSAKTLAQRLNLSYQELTDLVTIGFLNPTLNAVILQFQRFGISLSDALNYTGQPGSTALSPQAKTDFEAALDAITARYKQVKPASTFDARAWLAATLPADTSNTMLVLRDPSTGCNFTGTTFQYASGGAATRLDFLKLNVFVRLWKKLGWTLDECDRAMRLFFRPAMLSGDVSAWADADAAAFTSALRSALVYIAQLDDLNARLKPALGRTALLPLWSSIPTLGNSPLYGQLFLTPGVLNNDWGFDDPAGQFPWSTTDPLASHQPAIQGVLGLTADHLAAILADAAATVDTVNVLINGQNTAVPAFTLNNLSICYRYSVLAKCLELTVPDLIALKAMSGLNPFQPLGLNPLGVLADDILLSQTLAFVNQARTVSDSGFTMEDLKFLLRHQFDPVGEYRSDPNARIALVQSIANGLQQIQAQNAVPADLASAPESAIEQQLSRLLPAAILKALFATLTNSRTYQVSVGGVAVANKVDPAPFAGETQMAFSYDPVTGNQTLTYQGLLLDWKRDELLAIKSSPVLIALFAGVQAAAPSAFGQSLDDVLGVWASLAEYQAVRTGVAAAVPAAPLTQADPAVTLSYDQADQLQWLAYRGVLSDAKKAALLAVNNSADLQKLLQDIQQQSATAYNGLVGTLLAMWVSTQTYRASVGGVADANKIDPAVFAAYPQVHLEYDAGSQTQTLAYDGTLTDAARKALAALIPASVALATLLQKVRDQATSLFLALAANLLTVTAADLDSYSPSFLGADTTGKQKAVKAELVTVFMPLLAQKLSRELVIQTLTSDLGSDASLTTALTTDAGLLTDPSAPGKSLLGTFLALAQIGVTASFYASNDSTGAALATGTAATVDMGDPLNPNAGKAGTGSAHFEGYLQVPTDGPYRFFAELGNQNAQVVFQLDAPDSTALLDNPVLQKTAAGDNDEASQFVQLKGGAAYHFTVDLSLLGPKGAALLVQGENLPKGPLSQIMLYPQAVVDAVGRARVLLSKVLQIAQGTGLAERELSYMAANAADFNGFTLSGLPTRPSDDSLPKAVKLFAQFLSIADYADLRKGPAGGSDGLVDVFENVGQAFTEPAGTHDSNKDVRTPWTRLANLTRRNPQVVRDIALALGMLQEVAAGANTQVKATGDFANSKGVRRLWEALRLVQLVGIPVSALTASTVIASLAPPAGSPTPDVIATTFKNAIKARFTPAAWNAVAQSIFDKLRRKKRDALVAYLVNALQLEDANSLFEYFLVDPGMEPIVQTSRLRLALSSVQTFVQRCLLNLENANVQHPENNIAPAAIDADWWAWMKRYRVWEANRKIFLFPENWMEPELRLDKTDLFQSLESALLQGDVTPDLVEDSFLTYLKGLDVRARLNIVAMYLDQDPAHPEASTLYVLGRTYGKPHKYFLRTYANGTWSGWEALTLDIDGNHIVLAVWRGRLNIFWVTFVAKPLAPDAQSTTGDTTKVSDMTFDSLKTSIYSAAPLPQVQVQLSWSERIQGKWSNRISTDIDHYAPIRGIGLDFDLNREVFVHVSKELDASGNEGAVLIHLDIDDGEQGYAFRVTSKNCAPDFDPLYWEAAPSMPYEASGVDATLHVGAVTLAATFDSHVMADGSGTPTTETILGSAGAFELLTCANPVAPSPFLNPADPLFWEAGGLVSPFFYSDRSATRFANRPWSFDELTFFVQPSLTEQTMSQWEGWAVSPPASKVWDDANLLQTIEVRSQVPQRIAIPPNPGDPVYSTYRMQPAGDWATSPATAVAYSNSWIGSAGAINADHAPIAATLALVGGSGLTLGKLQSIRARGAIAANGSANGQLNLRTL